MSAQINRAIEFKTLQDVPNDFITPCLRFAFKEFITTYFPELKQLDINPTGFSIFGNDKFLFALQEKYLEFEQNSYSPLKEFFEKKADTYEIFNGVIDPQCSVVSVHKSKKQECNRCEDHGCYFSKLKLVTTP